MNIRTPPPPPTRLSAREGGRVVGGGGAGAEMDREMDRCEASQTCVQRAFETCLQNVL